MYLSLLKQRSLLITCFILICKLSLFYAQTNCPTCATDTDCLAKAKSCLTVSCGIFVTYFKHPGEKLNNGFESVYDKANYDLITIPQPNNSKLKGLVIKSLNSSDTGNSSYYATEDGEGVQCRYNIFVYDKDTADGRITIGNRTESLLTTNKFDVAVKSFDEIVTFSFRYEGLPLNNLMQDGTVIKKSQVDECMPDNPWLKCLETKNILIPIEECKSAYSLKLSYDYDFKQQFQQTVGNPKVFEHNINLQFPPIVKEKFIVREITNFSEVVPLDCEVKCGNPSVYEYKWIFTEKPNEIVSKEKTYKFSFNTDMTENIAELECIVTNAINQNDNDNLSDSRTLFRIKYTNRTDEIVTNTTEIATTTLSGETTTLLTTTDDCGDEQTTTKSGTLIKSKTL